MSSFRNAARQDASALKNVKLFLREPLAESVQMEQQLQVEQMQQMDRSVIKRTAELLNKKPQYATHVNPMAAAGRTLKAKACLHSSGVGRYDAVAGFSRAVSTKH